jgi:3'-phosphoadenosine 5'-phosphosulfate sulfotransferase (PAPS reductase)/FAD synthetase
MLSINDLTARQRLPLHIKMKMSEAKIAEYYTAHAGKIDIAFSGGLDSLVLAHLARQRYPDIPLVFSNTGQEYPEITDFVKAIPDIEIVRPVHSYKWVLEHHGYPVVSKAVSIAISRYRTAKDDVQRNLRLHGGINPSSGKLQRIGVIPKKYHYLIDAPFKISDKCCDVLKKNPMKKYAKETGRSPMTGELAEDSNSRKMQYLEHGCNFYGATHKSTPLGFWTHQDILAYIKKFNVPYCEIYGDIIFDEKIHGFRTTGEQHTGCFDCMFGANKESEENPDGNNRFTRMRCTHPDRHHICINVYGQGKVLDFMGVRY